MVPVVFQRSWFAGKRQNTKRLVWNTLSVPTGLSEFR